MKIRRRFTIYNIIMLMTPIMLIGVVSVGFLLVFVMKYPVEQLQLPRAALINPRVLSRAIGAFFQDNPSALGVALLWIGLCLLIIIVTTTVVTMLMSRSIKRPIDSLTRAAECVRRGNLGFEVMGSDYDEVDRLCTEFDSMRRALRQAAKKEELMKHERSMLLANLSHDLKTPVTSIKGYVDGIRDGVADTPEKLQKYLDTIYQKAEIIDDMVNNLSVFSKLELSRVEFKFEYGSLGAYLEDFCGEYRMDLERHDISLETEFDDKGALVKIDYEQMGRVFANLIDNAIKYKKDGRGRLYVKTFTKDGGVYAELSDDGIGIRKDELKNVFDSFYRVDGARNMNIKGSGLGLGIVKQIVERHGGRIWLKSDGENTGTKAVLYLPEVRADMKGEV